MVRSHDLHGTLYHFNSRAKFYFLQRLSRIDDSIAVETKYQLDKNNDSAITSRCREQYFTPPRSAVTSYVDLVEARLC
jgi:hypothetical protein